MNAKDIIAYILSAILVVFVFGVVYKSVYAGREYNDHQADLIKGIIASVITILAMYMGDKNSRKDE